MKFKITAALLLTSILGLFGCSSANTNDVLTYTDTLFDTVISIKIYDTADQSILKGCEDICIKYDTMFSRTNEKSEIYKTMLG